MSKWLITGTGGFLGRAITRQLMTSGDDVTALRIRRDTSELTPFKAVVSLSTSVEDLKLALKGLTFDYVLNLAAAGVHPADRDIKTLEDINIALPEALIELCGTIGNPAYVLAGSCSEYAPPADNVLLNENSLLEKKKLYGKTKAIGNQRALFVANNNSVRAMIARIFNLYGPGESNHRLVPSLLNDLLKGQTANLSDGLQVRDFMHVEDAARSLIALAKTLGTSELSSPQNVNLCTGIGTSVRDFAITACRAAGFTIEALHFGAIERRADDIQYLVGDPSKLVSYLGSQSFLSVNDGVGSYVRHLLKSDSMKETVQS